MILQHFSFLDRILGVFGLLQLVAFTELVRSHVAEKQFKSLLQYSMIILGAVGIGAFVGLTVTGKIAPWTGRFYSLWDTEYAKKSVARWSYIRVSTFI